MNNTTTSTTPTLMAIDQPGCRINSDTPHFVGLLLTTTTTPAKLLAWSRWRRQHQARARTSHYQRREHQ